MADPPVGERGGLERGGGIPVEDKAAGIKHEKTVGEGKDLLELVGQHDDRLAVGLEGAEYLVHLKYSRPVEAGVGLVEDDELGVDRQDAGDGEAALLAA